MRFRPRLYSREPLHDQAQIEAQTLHTVRRDTFWDFMSHIYRFEPLHDEAQIEAQTLHAVKRSTFGKCCAALLQFWASTWRGSNRGSNPPHSKTWYFLTVLSFDTKIWTEAQTEAQRFRTVEIGVWAVLSLLRTLVIIILKGMSWRGSKWQRANAARILAQAFSQRPILAPLCSFPRPGPG